MKDYYQASLEHLRVLGTRFAEAHPMIAPLLNNQSADPDVERILEGTAFLCGLIEQRLDQNFPEIVYGLLDITAPELLQPIPSQTLIQFTPLPQVQGIQQAAAGSLLDSVPVDGQTCPFAVARDLDILPVHECQTSFEQRNGETSLRLQLKASAPAQLWLGNTLPLYVNGAFGRASQWHMLLLRHVSRVDVRVGGQNISLPASALTALMPPLSPFKLFDEQRLTDLGMVRDYFAFPEKFLFVQLAGLSRLDLASENSSTVEIVFNLHSLPEYVPAVDTQLLAVNVVPAMNVFPHAANPFLVPHTRQDYRLAPEGDRKRALGIYRIERVTGIRRGGDTRTYVPYSAFQRNGDDMLSYTLRRAVSAVNGRLEYYIGLLHNSADDVIDDETLTATLLCYHHSLPLRLLAGDVSSPTDSSPAMATFTNIIKPTTPSPAPDNPDLLWQFFSHLHANLLPLSSAKALRECLSLYIPANEASSTLLLLNKRRIDSIKKFRAEPEETLIKGRPIRGQGLWLELESDGFSSLGEMHLFGMVLEQAFRRYAPLNSYIRLRVQDSTSGEIITWQPKIGNKQLL